jgi:hypothetical protein
LARARGEDAIVQRADDGFAADEAVGERAALVRAGCGRKTSEKVAPSIER